MATTFKTVSEESSWTNWTGTAQPEATDRPSTAAKATKVAIGIALLLAIVFAWPTGLTW